MVLNYRFGAVMGYNVDVPSFGSNWGFNLAFDPNDENDDRASFFNWCVRAQQLQQQQRRPPAARSALTAHPAPSPRREPARIDALIAKRIAAKFPNGEDAPLRHYDGVSHRGAFSLPKTIRDAMASEERIMTVANPVFMY